MLMGLVTKAAILLVDFANTQRAEGSTVIEALAKLLGMYRRYRTVALLEGEYDAALTKQPNDFAALVVRARLALAQRDDAAALPLFERAAAVRTDAAVLVELGSLYRTHGKLAEARAALDKALAANPAKPTKMKALRALAVRPALKYTRVRQMCAAIMSGIARAARFAYSAARAVSTSSESSCAASRLNLVIDRG